AGSRGGTGELGGGGGPDPVGVLAGAGQDGAGQLVPGARALVGEVVGAVLAGALEGADAVGQVGRVGRAAHLVVDHPEGVALAGQAQDGGDEVAAPDPVHPGGPDHVGAVPDLAHGLLAGQLGPAVDAGRGRLVVLAVAVGPPVGGGAVEHVVGGQVDQLGVDLAAGQGQVAGADAVGQEGAVGGGPAGGDGGPGGRVHHQVG